MKYFSLLIISFYACLSLKNGKYDYMKINKSDDVDLFYEIKDSLNSSKINYYVKNKTNDTFIIDPFGYIGKTDVFENEKLMIPYKLRIQGSYERSSDKSCERDLIILLPHETKKVRNFNVNYIDNGLYNFSPKNNYYRSVKSVHSRQTVTYLGCDEYIRKLEKKGYHILEDSIVAKIPILP